jgi:hypothetical protein
MLVEKVTAAYNRGINDGRPPVVQLYGNDSLSQYAIAAGFCTACGFTLWLMSAQDIPREPRELEALVCLWDRQAILTGSALLLDCNDIETSDRAEENTVNRFIREIQSTLILVGRERRLLPARFSLSFEVAKPTHEEQLELWQEVLSEDNPDGELEFLVSQFNLNTATIQSVYDEARRRRNSNNGSEAFGTVLWDVCRLQTRRRLDELAQRIESSAMRDDLVLPDVPRQLLDDVATQVRQRDWV